MRVRLRDAASVPASDQARFAAWIDPGKEYVVLEISGPWLRLHDEPVSSHTPGLWEARYFDVTSTALPRNWTADLDAEGRVQLAPRRWLDADFWPA